MDGENIGALTLAGNNKLYGVAASGGVNAQGVFGGGTLFEYDLDTDRFKVIQHFGPANTALPNAYVPRAEGFPSLTEVSPGVLYGLMFQGDYVFSYNMSTGVLGKPFTLPTFLGGAMNTTQRNRICQAFYKASDGFFYAATPTNSSCPIPNPNMGSIVRLTPSTNTFTIRHKSSCQAEFGYGYNGHFAEANGKLYSTANLGGTNNQGIIFEYTLATNTFTKRHDFSGGLSGYEPSSLVFGKNGKLYGTAYGGGVSEPNLPYGGGILYEFDLTTNTFDKKHDFIQGVGWVQDMGSFPRSLVAGTNGKLYGVTEFGVFEYNIDTEDARIAARFNDRGYAPTLMQLCRKPAYQYQATTTYSVCEGEPFSLNLTSTNSTTTQWKHNGTIDGIHQTPFLDFPAFSEADAGTWICTMTNECGTTVAQALTITLNEPTQPTISAAGPITFCVGESVTLSAPSGFSSYTWSTGETTQSIVVSGNGQYAVSVNNGCESPLSDVVNVTVNALPAAPAEIDVISFNVLKATGDSDSYEWRLDGVLLDEHTSEIQATASGVYSVTSMNANGCHSAGSASLSFIIMAAETDQANTVVIYPNPAKDLINLKANDIRGRTEISIFNAKGSLVITQSLNLTTEVQSVNIERLIPGSYHIAIRNGQKIIVQQFIKR